MRAAGWLWILVLATGLLGGCGGSYEGSHKGSEAAPSTAMGGAAGAVAMQVAEAGEAGVAETLAAVGNLPVDRHIIYNASVDLVAENLRAVEEDLLRRVEARNGYVSQSEVSGAAGAPRIGHWTVRIPVQQFKAFLDDVGRLAELQRLSVDSEDVTEEYVDLETRIANKKVEEERLLQHLRSSTSRLQDILAVEKELSRVRGEVERMQGRLRFLKDRTSYSTVRVTVHEARTYLPPERTTFLARVGRTFRGSWEGLLQAGEGLVLLGVMLIPWALVLALISTPVWLLWRRGRGEPG